MSWLICSNAVSKAKEDIGMSASLKLIHCRCCFRQKNHWGHKLHALTLQFMQTALKWHAYALLLEAVQSHHGGTGESKVHTDWMTSVQLQVAD